MNYTVATYLLYLLIVIPVTIWVARVLFRNGQVFLKDVFRENEELAGAVNALLVVGFYLLNLGFVTLYLRLGGEVVGARGMLEGLSAKVGVVLLVLGVIHLGNVWVFSRWRRRSLIDQDRRPPVPATGQTTVGLPPATGPFVPAGPTAPPQ